jgi:hypothetical protein
VEQLREAGVSGVLTYSDDDCRLHAVSLPELAPAPAPSFQMCRPATSTGGLGAVDGQVVWAGLGYGAVQVVLSREELSREIGRRLSIPSGDGAGFRAVQAVSLDVDRYAVLADSTHEPTERVLAFAQGERVVVVQPGWVVRDARFLRPSPRGGYVAALGGEEVRWFDRNAVPLPLPATVRGPRTIAWSPDDRWVALATDEGVYVFRSERPQGPVLRVPLSVRDLDWSDEPQVASVP